MRQTDSQAKHHWCVPVIYLSFASCLPLMLAGSARGQEESATVEVAEPEFEIGRAGHSLEGAFRLGGVKATQEGFFADLVVLDG